LLFVRRILKGKFMIESLLMIGVGVAIAAAVAAFYVHYHTAKALVAAQTVVSGIQADVAVLKAKV
jgi:uncharacterized membrane protein YwzB